MVTIICWIRNCDNMLDGAQVISYMDISDEHTDQLIGAINDIKGNAWTPLAEAMYTAIGLLQPGYKHAPQPQ